MKFSLQHLFFAPITEWINQHSVLSWLLAHPLSALALVALGMTVLLSFLLFVWKWKFWSTVRRANEKLWTFIFVLPLKIIYFFLQQIFTTLKSVGSSEISLVKSHPPEDRLTKVINRLEEIKQEEIQLLSEMKSLIK